MSKTAKLYKAACSLNLAVLLRAVRFGPRDAVRRAVRAYDLINPLAREKGREPWDDPRADPRVWNLLAIFTRIELSEAISARRSIIIDGSLAYADGSLGIQDQAALMSLLRDREPDVVLEIGTYNGATTRLIALNLPRAKIHTLDLPPDISSEELHQSKLPKDDFHLIGNRRVGEAFLSDPAITNVTQHFGDSATWDFSPVQGLDFVFIDGSHTYQYVRSDTIRCAEAAAGRATFVWHDFDYCHYDVVRYLTEMASAGLPVRHIASTNMAMMDYDRSLHLAKIRAVGNGSRQRLRSRVRRPRCFTQSRNDRGLQYQEITSHTDAEVVIQAAQPVSSNSRPESIPGKVLALRRRLRKRVGFLEDPPTPRVGAPPRLT